MTHDPQTNPTFSRLPKLSLRQRRAIAMCGRRRPGGGRPWRLRAAAAGAHMQTAGEPVHGGRQ